ncbi:hypothetical protein B0I37DRAFT_381530 [Chaetomium sp. MPI-CAGE-AT-0009]|nr:hypothetical protein B0I37DRAFT_381530 [Chaetomium sp. MPI-CAGE-AT-0009]
MTFLLSVNLTNPRHHSEHTLRGNIETQKTPAQKTMRFFKAILAFAALAVALPSEKGPVDEVKAREPAADGPILDYKIDAYEKEKRTVNLSPRNNPQEGLLPRQCSSSSNCPCASNARSGLWCGYCVSPVDAIPKCRSGSCMDHVFQCGGGGACCSYGYRASCANRRGPCGS